MVDFKGERCTKLCFGGYALMENRSGLYADRQITGARSSEPVVARQLLVRLRRKRIHAQSLGADKGYHSKVLIEHLRAHHIRPHIARIEGHKKTSDLDARTTRHADYRSSQRARKRIEEIFRLAQDRGWGEKEPRSWYRPDLDTALPCSKC